MYSCDCIEWRGSELRLRTPATKCNRQYSRLAQQVKTV
jgi:hypothetical protein